MKKYHFNLGEIYGTERTAKVYETIPANPVFKSLKDEDFFYEPQKRVSYSQVSYNLQQGYLTGFDLKVLSLIGTFSSVCIPTRVLKNLLCMSGEDLGSKDHRLTNSLERLWQNNLVAFGRFKAPEKLHQSSLRIIMLSGYGSRVIKSMGIDHRFNPLEIIDASTAKSRAQTASMISNFIEYLPGAVESFEVRPVIARKELYDDGIVRPAARITLFGEDVYFEVPRSGNPEYLSNTADKLRRYVLSFETIPNVVINGEDEEMNRTIYNYLKEHSEEHGFDLGNILFTDDLAQFGPGFKTCLYAFDENGDRVCFSFTQPEREAA